MPVWNHTSVLRSPAVAIKTGTASRIPAKLPDLCILMTPVSDPGDFDHASRVGYFYFSFNSSDRFAPVTVIVILMCYYLSPPPLLGKRVTIL